MQYAFIITLMIAVPMAMLSCFLVLKGWSLMGDAVSHAVLPGVVIAYIAGIPLSIGAFTAGMICALGTGFIKENSRIKEDTVLGIVFSGMFGLGLVLYVKVQSDMHLDHILFGDMLGIAPSDMLETGLIALFATLFLGVLRKDLLVNAFDPQHAKAIGSARSHSALRSADGFVACRGRRAEGCGHHPLRRNAGHPRRHRLSAGAALFRHAPGRHLGCSSLFACRNMAKLPDRQRASPDHCTVHEPRVRRNIHSHQPQGPPDRRRQ